MEVARNGVALSLASAYLNVLFQKEFLDIAKLNAEATGRQVERVQTLVDAGAAAESDLLDVLAQQANDESAVIGAENGVTLAKLNLAQVLQLEASASDALDVAPPTDDLMESTVLPVNAGAAVAFALGSFPDMKAASCSDRRLSRVGTKTRMPRIVGSCSMGSGYRLTDWNKSGIHHVLRDSHHHARPEFDRTCGGRFRSDLRDHVFPGPTLEQRQPEHILLAEHSVFNNFGIHAGIERQKWGCCPPNSPKHKRRKPRKRFKPPADAGPRAHLRRQQQALEAASLAMTTPRPDLKPAPSPLEYADARTHWTTHASALRTEYDFVFKTRILDFYMGHPLSL